MTRCGLLIILSHVRRRSQTTKVLFQCLLPLSKLPQTLPNRIQRWESLRWLGTNKGRFWLVVQVSENSPCLSSLPSICNSTTDQLLLISEINSESMPTTVFIHAFVASNPTTGDTTPRPYLLAILTQVYPVQSLAWKPGQLSLSRLAVCCGTSAVYLWELFEGLSPENSASSVGAYQHQQLAEAVSVPNGELMLRKCESVALLLTRPSCSSCRGIHSKLAEVVSRWK